MVIDIHSHIVPAPVFERFARHRAEFPGVELIMEDGPAYRFRFPDAPMTRPVMAALPDLSERKQVMASQGVDHAVLSLWTDLEGYELNAQEGFAWSCFVNQCLLDQVRDETAFTPLASVPLQDGALASRVLEQAMQDGFGGVMIGTQPKGARGGNLDDPDLEIFWATAARLGAAVYVHPMFICNEPRLADYDMTNAVGRLADATIAIGRVIASGLLQRHPDLNIVLSHGGAALPLAVGRLRRSNEAAGNRFADPDDGLSRFYVDTCVYDTRALTFVIDAFGADHVMLGTDAPMSIAELDPVGLVDSVRLRTSERRAILGDTARRVFRLRGCAC
ncbi:MAG: amidohydrolase [Beijerinckiaceae bacterium]|nr:amidohydrolase [Beijerinckiaceae bacterium]